ncbi:hypothetical protein FOZ62_016637 [Perkinsus olseni]|uniref:MULE transposase domain-containing protein n=1 Tax=Perkinsus olseni TaxID=32597 RepID=A0A7J6TQR9_PEROL|nr:hypothetical protein FOZ62_016637 [Perkinsus olseni]
MNPQVSAALDVVMAALGKKSVEQSDRPATDPIQDEVPERGRGRGPGASYVPATDEIFPSLESARDALAALADLPEGLNMIANNRYAKAIWRFRCPFNRKRVWVSCPFAMRVEAAEDGHGFRIFMHETHPQHVATGMDMPGQRRQILAPKAREVVRTCCIGGATAKGTLRALREEKLLPLDGTVTASQLRKAVYNTRHQVRSKNPERPRPASSALIDVDRFCQEHSDVPADPHQSFCLCYESNGAATVDDAEEAGTDMWYYFSTPHLLERGASYSVWCMDYTHSLSYCPYPTVLIGGVTPPGRFRIIMIGVSLHEDTCAIEQGLKALKTYGERSGRAFQPRALLSDSASCFTRGFSRVFGEFRPLGLSPSLELKDESDKDSNARLYCYVHMWRQTLRHAAPLLRASVGKEQYEKLRAQLKHDILLLQRVPEEHHFPILAQHLERKWKLISESTWRYFSEIWLMKHGNWYQMCATDVVGPEIGRTSNGVEGINGSLKRGGVNVNFSLGALLSEVRAVLSDYSTMAPIEADEGFCPTSEQVMQGFRSARMAYLMADRAGTMVAWSKRRNPIPTISQGRKNPTPEIMEAMSRSRKNPTAEITKATSRSRKNPKAKIVKAMSRSRKNPSPRIPRDCSRILQLRMPK